MAGTWKFTDAALADKIARVIEIERTFFSDRGPPQVVVVAWQLGTGGTTAAPPTRTLANGDSPKITSERVIAMIEGLTSTAFAARVRATAVDKLVKLDVGTPIRHVEYLPHGAAFTVPEFSVGDESACAQIVGEPIRN